MAPRRISLAQRKKDARRVRQINRDFIRGETPTTSWEFNWVGGGWNTVTAESWGEAVREAEKLGREVGMEPDLNSLHVEKYVARENPLGLSTTTLVVGGLVAVAAVGGLFYYFNTKKAAAAQLPVAPATPPKAILNKPADALIPGHTYRMSSLAPPGSTTDQIATALTEVGWTDARAWTFGDVTAPADYNWPPETRSANGVLMEAKWGGVLAAIPHGFFGIVDYASS
jgi:hypothetical protein